MVSAVHKFYHFNVIFKTCFILPSHCVPIIVYTNAFLLLFPLRNNLKIFNNGATVGAELVMFETLSFYLLATILLYNKARVNQFLNQGQDRCHNQTSRYLLLMIWFNRRTTSKLAERVSLLPVRVPLLIGWFVSRFFFVFKHAKQ